MNQEFSDLSETILGICREARVKLATAESCTGGMVAAALTAIAGSSDVVERGFVTYTNEAKSELLGVPAETIAAHGAVSAETAEAMAKGAIAHAPVDLAVSVIGIAGPGGATPTKPVGLVLFGLARRDGKKPHRTPRLLRRPQRSAARGARGGAPTPRSRGTQLTPAGAKFLAARRDGPAGLRRS